MTDAIRVWVDPSGARAIELESVILALSAALEAPTTAADRLARAIKLLRELRGLADG